MSNLRWSYDKIRLGFDRFKSEKGRLPSASEIDSLSYLPSSRQIQRKFGGLYKLRESLGYSRNDFSRTDIATKSGHLGLASERIIEQLLIQHFGEEFVHIEKRWGNGKNRLDFYVYKPGSPFGVEVISAKNRHSLISNLNIKFPKYWGFSFPLYLVVISKQVKQKEIAEIIQRKQNQPPQKMQIVDVPNFKRIIAAFPRFFASINNSI